jgi:hypothetical protein
MSNLLSELRNTKPTKFSAATAGSEVTIQRGGEAPWKGIVVANHPEYGPSRLPAIYVQPDEGGDAELIMGNGRAKLVVERAALRPSKPVTPGDAVELTAKPTTSTAVLFHGGMGSASSIIRWASGYAAIEYRADPDDELLIPGGGTDPDVVVLPGDYVVCTASNRFTKLTANEAAELYEIKQLVAG